MKMTIFFIFFIFLISIVLVSITSKGEIIGLLNESGFVHYTLTHFNDSLLTKNVIILPNIKNGDISSNFLIPQNATILSAKMNITGSDSIFNLLETINLENEPNASLIFNYLDFNGTHFFIDCTYDDNGDNNFLNDCVAIYNLSGNYTGQVNITSGDSLMGIDGLKVNGTQVYVSNNSANRIYSHTISTNLRTSILNYPNCRTGTISGLEFNGSFFYYTDSTFSPSSHLCAINTSNSTLPSIIIYSTPQEASGGSDTDLFLTSKNNTIYVIHWGAGDNGNLIRLNLTANTSLIVANTLTTENSIAGDDNYIYIGVSSPSNAIKIYSREGLPVNLNLSVNSTPFFSFEGQFNRSNGTSNFNNYIQSYLKSCVPNKKGYCNVSINISSITNGKILLSNLEINYTYGINSTVDVIQFTNKTYNFTPFSFMPILKKFRISNLFPTTDLNITGFFVNFSTTSCFIDGVSRKVGINAFRPYCNLTTHQIINSTGGTWTNHTLFDNTTLGTYSPVNLTNTTLILNNSKERIKFFNVTSFYPNGSIANDSLSDIIYNITVEINLTDTDLPNISKGYEQGIRWFNGSGFISINVSNSCQRVNDFYEDNYTYTINAGLNWSGCHNDTNNNNIWDYFKILVPKLSNQEFYVFGQEDTKFPNITIIQPVGTKSSSSIDISLNVTDDVGLDLCYYNITDDTEVTVAVPRTTFACGNFTGNHTISTNDDYFINIFANDTSGNINITRGSFSVNIQAGGGQTGGGGGGSSPILIFADFNKSTCNLQFVPPKIILTKENTLAKLDLINNEDRTLSPTFIINNSNLISVKGELQKLIPAKSTVEYTILLENTSIFRDSNLSSINAGVTLITNECKNLFQPIEIIIQEKKENPIATFLNQEISKIKITDTKDFSFKMYQAILLFSIISIGLFYLPQTKNLKFTSRVSLIALSTIMLTLMLQILIGVVR